MKKSSLQKRAGVSIEEGMVYLLACSVKGCESEAFQRQINGISCRMLYKTR